MQILRSFWWRCAATAFLFSTFLFSTLLFSLSVAAQDSEAQAKARQALEQRIKEAQTQTPAVIEVEPAKPAEPAPAPAPKQTPPPKQTAPPKAATQPKPAATSEAQFMNMPQATSAEAADKLNQALRQKEMELDAQRPVQPVTAAPIAHTAPAAASTGYVMPASATTVHVGTAQPQPAGTVVHVGTPTATKPSKGKPVVAAAATPTGPPTGLSASKTQRLADLNQQYNMDKVTPEEYHRQRAKILSEP